MPGSEGPPEGWPGWPEGKQFAFVLTHDVEGQRGLDRVMEIAKLELKLGFRSSFNFVPEGKYQVPLTLRKWLVDHGFEVGVHDLHHDGKLFSSRDEFRRKAQRINFYLKEWNAAGFRSGFMLHNLEWIRDLEIQYDSSTFDTDPFEPQPDGVHTIFPFWVPRCPMADSIDHQPSTLSKPHSQHSTLNPFRNGYVELPYTMPQDSTMFLLLNEKTTQIWESKLRWLCSCGGMALMNVHPDYVDLPGTGSSYDVFPARLYENFLSSVSNNYRDRFWNPAPRELADWYSKTLSISDSEPAISSEGTYLSKPLPSLAGKRAAVVLYSHYPSDPRPRRAAESMAQAGMHVDLFCLRDSESELKRETIEGVNVRRLPIEKKRGSKSAYILQYSKFLIVCLLILGRRTLEKRYDIVHVHNMPDFLTFSALLPKIFGAKVILDLHDPMPELMQSIYRLSPVHWAVKMLIRLERWSIAFADLVLTPNIAFRKLFVLRGCPPEKIKIVMNSPQGELFNAARFSMPANSMGDRNGSFKLMFHGLIAERHGLDTAIRALACLRTDIPGLEFHIFGGKTAYMDKMIELVNELQLQQTVHYHGFKTQNEIARALASADVGIIPNRRSPFTEINMPTRIFENIAMGKPVIVPNTVGIRDYFNEKQIVFFNPDSADSLADAIRWVYNNPRDAQEMVEQGRCVLKVHTWDLERENLLESVRHLLQA
ncbi:MAG TPA: glycosyltransferase [Terrimicrobiaceae bacterium]